MNTDGNGELPEGWSEALVGDLVEITSGKYRKRSEYSDKPDKPYPVAGAAGPIGWCDEANTQPPIMTLGRVGSAGALSQYSQACWVTDNALIVRPNLGEWFAWFGYFFRTVNWSDLSTGSSQPLITQTQVNALRIALPPLAEQQRIVAAVEAVLARVNAARERLNRVPAILKRFRQAALSAACSGQLTADWREKHGVADEPTENEDGIEYPDSWSCKLTAELVEPGTAISYGIVLPGPNLPEGVPYIRGLDIDDAGRIHVGQLFRTSTEIAAKHKRSEIREGDVLLCVIRNLRVAIVPPGIDGANLTQGTVRLRPSKEILGSYLAYYLAGPQAQDWMKTRYVGSDMPRINVEHTRTIPVPVPPLAEQQEIVRRASDLFALADVIESQLTDARRMCDQLTQAVLAKAFRGGLVPTEAELARRENRNYEPAGELLARIRAECEQPAAPANGKPTRKSRRTSGAGD